MSDTSSYSFIEPADGAGPAAGGIGGGPAFEPHAIFYIRVDDVAAALVRVRELGGQVVLDVQRNDAGGVAVGHFTDPAGNLIGVAGPL